MQSLQSLQSRCSIPSLYKHIFCPISLTWWITLNDWMVVHLQSGIATAACEAYNMVLAVIYYDSRLINGDVICPHIEDDTNFSLILQRTNTQRDECDTRNKPYLLNRCAKCFSVHFRVVELKVVFQQ